MEPRHWLAELFRKTQMGGGFDAARGQPFRDQIVLLPVSCVPPSRPTGHWGPPRDHCGLGGGWWRARGSPQAVCIAAGEASPGVRVAPRAPSKTPRVFRARCGPASCPAPSSSAHEGSPGHCGALAQLAGARCPPALWPNDRLHDTNHVLAAGVPERETPAAPPPPPASLVLILSFLPPARTCCNRHAAGVPRAPAARPWLWSPLPTCPRLHPRPSKAGLLPPPLSDHDLQAGPGARHGASPRPVSSSSRAARGARAVHVLLPSRGLPTVLNVGPTTRRARASCL